ncbi:MAG: acyl-ACP--UDP-N-acetylglucosamine O-acyltransferase [Endomicrobium sp.]|jgi:UDP-N-acetylglucosamine acyltransferase|uniref:acyl-ACP--UDP-N-acetylglucosamine O-acyltransferase n=1 Tax=Candidatus Endomicrobiellum cubanum TaxID=3242325 RepID=UPI00282EDE92|nr:acyl-ACP--UDP-N-acetylglucosamine O-acyltransferase [Endomicrobium sp.]
MIHKTAIIDGTAILGDNVSIGAYTVIGKDVVIGKNVIIGSNVFIEHAQIGDNCKVYNSASIGTPPQDLSYNDEPSKVYIGDGTTVREFVTFNRGSKKTGKTVIGKNCYFMTSSHVAHDCRIGDYVIMANCSAAGGHVEIGDNAFISGLVGIHQFVKIGKDTMTGVGAAVTMDIIPYALCAGDRVKLDGLNLVGMKRRKISSMDIDAVKEAYRILFKSKLLLKDALSKLEQIQSVCVKEIIKFVESSKRGLARP